MEKMLTYNDVENIIKESKEHLERLEKLKNQNNYN